jgi:hypothetical protein
MSDPTDAYTGQVADIIASDPRESSYAPAKPVELFVKGRRHPTNAGQLSAIEHQQLVRMFRGEDLDTILRENTNEGMEGMELDLEIANVVDDTGTPRYRMYGMNYGAVYLMEADSLECLAFASQHDLEHWHADQRELFWAMDRAMRRNDHGFQQPMKWCWWKDECWAEIADKPRGTVQSEPYVRQQFAGEN